METAWTTSYAGFSPGIGGMRRKVVLQHEPQLATKDANAGRVLHSVTAQPVLTSSMAVSHNLLHGVTAWLQATMYGAVAAAQCNMACAGDRSQMCGFVSAARQLLSLYQVSLVINIGGNRALRAGH